VIGVTRPKPWIANGSNCSGRQSRSRSMVCAMALQDSGPRGRGNCRSDFWERRYGVPPTATSDFDFLHEHQLCSSRDMKCGLGRFLQSDMTSERSWCVLRYGDSEALRFARRIRAAISEWLTTADSSDEHLSMQSAMIGSPGYIEQRWGKAVRFALDSATEAARALSGTESPARVS